MLAAVDVLHAEELRALVHRGWFRAYAFAAEELAYADSCAPSRSLEFLSGRFAAKEAVVKALGCGFTDGVRPRQVIVTRRSDGAPQVRLRGAAARAAARQRIDGFQTSIAHKRRLVVATVVAHQRDNAGGRMTVESTSKTDAEAGQEPVEASLRLRMAPEDAHYGGALVAGSRLLELFGDLVTEITVRTDGDEGLLAEYDRVRFLGPVYPGDWIEATARLSRRTRLRRTVELAAYKVIAAGTGDAASSASVLEPPEQVCTATATTVVPLPRPADRTAAHTNTAGDARQGR